MELRMSKQLDGLAFQAYCRRLNFSKETQALLADIRAAPPVRTPRSNRGNVSVYYPSLKMGFIIKAESHRVEFAFIIEAEHDGDVLEYYDQAGRMPLEYRDKNGRSQRPWHTADSFQFRYNAAGWEEDKTTEDLIRLAQEQPNRYRLDERGRWRCPPGEAFAARFGLTYTVRASDEINWVAQDNWLYLEDYYQDLEALHVPDAALEALHRIVDETPGITLTDLRFAAAASLSDGDHADHINIAIALHHLYVDLNRYRLTAPDRTPVYRDQETAWAYVYRGPGADDLGIDAHPVVIEDGQEVEWDGKMWRMAVGATEITLIREKAVFPMVRTAFEALVEAGKIVGVVTSTRSGLTEQGEELLACAREQDHAVAIFRNRVINPEDYDDDEQDSNAAARLKIPNRTSAIGDSATGTVRSYMAVVIWACCPVTLIAAAAESLLMTISRSSTACSQTTSIRMLAGSNAAHTANTCCSAVKRR